jgi:nicotinamidase-related amidase
MYEMNDSERSEGTFSRRNFLKNTAIGAVVGFGALTLQGCSAATADAQTSGGIGSAIAAESTPKALSSMPAKEFNTSFISQPIYTTYAEPPLADIEKKTSETKRLFVVVDYQVDFVDGAFGANDLAISLDGAIYNRVKEYQESGGLVFYTMDTHPEENYLLTREGGRISEHCVPGTTGWEVYGKTAELLTPENAIMVKKGSFGSKFLPDLINEMKSQGLQIESIELAGVSTTACVFHNAVILYNFFPEAEIILDNSTTAASDAEGTEAALAQLEGWGCVVNRPL